MYNSLLMVTMEVVCVVEPYAFCDKMCVGAGEWRGRRKKTNGNDDGGLDVVFWLARLKKHNKVAES